MPSPHRPALRSLTALVALVLTAAACGDSTGNADDAPSSEAPGSSTSDAAAPPTEVPETEVPATEPPTTGAEGTAGSESVSAGESSTTAPPTAPPATGAPPEPPPAAGAERIVVSDHALLDAALALELPVAAIPDFPDRETLPRYLGDRTEGIEVLDDITDVNLESLAAARPDLLLMSDKLVEASGVEDQLRQIAPLIALDIDTSRPWQDALRDLAELTGTSERAEELIAGYEQHVADAREQLGPDALAREVSIVRCFGPSCRYLPGASSFSGQVLADLGVARPEVQRDDPEGRAFVEVSAEQVDLLDGDVIVLFGTDAEESLRSLQDNPLWERLDAAQAGEVHLVDPQPWFFGNVFAARSILDDVVEILSS